MRKRADLAEIFFEDALDCHIIGDSLLGASVSRAKFLSPVGKVDMKTFYPVEMDELMIAIGEGVLKIALTLMSRCIQHSTMQLYGQYLVVGGIPECVMQFVQTRDYILIRHTQDTVLVSCFNDMSKYNNLNEIKKTSLAYDNITVQLSKKNRCFQYKLIKKGGRTLEFENAFGKLSGY